ARYVEFHCNGDMTTFKFSGFEPRSTRRSPQQQLSENIRWIVHGSNSGQLVLRLKAVPNALSYAMRYGLTSNGNPPAEWTTQLVPRGRAPTTIDALTPAMTRLNSATSFWDTHGIGDDRWWWWTLTDQNVHTPILAATS